MHTGCKIRVKHCCCVGLDREKVQEGDGGRLMHDGQCSTVVITFQNHRHETPPRYYTDTANREYQLPNRPKLLSFADFVFKVLAQAVERYLEGQIALCTRKSKPRKKPWDCQGKSKANSKAYWDIQTNEAYDSCNIGCGKIKKY